MISIAKITADIDGVLTLRNYQDTGDYKNTARISRTATLDGGSHFSHFGVTDTDRNFEALCRVSPSEFVKLKSLFEASTAIRISFWEGSFLGYIYRLSVGRDGKATIIFYFSEKLT